jgi:hypothetical protein
MSKHAEATAAALVAREQALAYLKERGLAKDQPVMERTKGDVNSVGTDNTVRMIRERNKAKAAAAAPVADDGGDAAGASAVRWTRLQDDASGDSYWWDSATGATSWSAPPGHAAESSGAAGGELYFMYRYISRESCSQFDSLPLTSLTRSRRVSTAQCGGV